MAVAMFMHWPGVTAEDYDALREPVNWEGDPPAGLLFHVAAFDQDGGHVTDVWESEDAANSFFRERLFPEVQRQGRMQGQPDVTFVQAHATFAPSYEAARI